MLLPVLIREAQAYRGRCGMERQIVCCGDEVEGLGVRGCGGCGRRMRKWEKRGAEQNEQA
jgi:hypothetical protein